MIKTCLLVALFLTLAMDELLNIGLLLVPGLSAKNAFLYVMLLSILLTKATAGAGGRVQFLAVHLLFLLLVTQVCVSIFYMHFVSGETAGYGLFGHVALLKSSLMDMYLMFLVFFYGTDNRATALNMVRFFLLVICLMSLLTLMDVFNMPSMGLISYRYGRLEGPLGQSNEYGVFLAFFIPMLMLMGLGARNGMLRAIYLLGAAISFVLLIQTGSRGSLAAMLGGLLLAGWWLHGHYDLGRAMKQGLVVALIAAVALVVVVAVTPDVNDMIQERVQRSSGGGIGDISSGRTRIWARALDYQMERPWTMLVGVGWGSFWNKIGIAPHSAYMNYFFSLGLIGLSLFVALIYTIFINLKQASLAAARGSEERIVLCGLILGWFVLIIAMVTGSIFKAWMFIWPLTGLCMRIGWCLMQEARANPDEPEPQAQPGSESGPRPGPGSGLRPGPAPGAGYPAGSQSTWRPASPGLARTSGAPGAQPRLRPATSSELPGRKPAGIAAGLWPPSRQGR